MIDIKFLRENPEVVKENIRKKFQDSKLSLVDEVIALDADRRKVQQEADELKAAKNKIAKQIGIPISSTLPYRSVKMIPKMSRFRNTVNPSYLNLRSLIIPR